MQQPRFRSLLALSALAGTALATPESGTYQAVSRDSEAIFDLFSVPVVGVAIFLVVLIFGMILGMQRSAHAAHMEQLERQRQALRSRRPPAGPASRPQAESQKQQVG